MKDNFTAQAAIYARYRPTYPAELYAFLFANAQAFELAWDCATGNGQVARALAEKFNTVIATDISAAQIDNAPKQENIRYRVGPAEHSKLDAHSADLITVGQAAHWFNLPAFYAEAKRCLKPGGLLAMFGYGISDVDPDTNALFYHFYDEVLGEYWDPERRFVDEGYASFDFPFQEIPLPEMHIEATWTRENALGFLASWSALQHFIKKNGYSPLNDNAFQERFAACWFEHEVKKVRFPMFGRIGFV